MNLNVQHIISNLDSISSVEDPDELQKLDDSVQQLLASEKSELGIDALLRVFERFPNKDGFGVFWSILSGLERMPNYEEKLIESVRRQPSEFGLLMVNRLLNARVSEVKGIKLLSLLQDVVTDNKQLEEIRAEAQGYVEWQQAKGEKT